MLFLLLGMLLGSDGLGWLDFGNALEDVELAQTIGIIALALILFEGGLSAGWSEIRPVLSTSLSLAFVGTILTAVGVGFAASWLLDLSLLEGMLIGSIVAATDSAAIFSVLRGSSIERRLARILEGESGFNDPVAILLVLGFIDWIQKPDYGLSDMVLLGVTELGIGAVVGTGARACSGALAFQRLQLGSPGLYPVASISLAALSFGLADVLHGSGFLAVYLTGLGARQRQHPRAAAPSSDFHDGLAWVSQIAVFFTLGLLVFPSEFGDMVGEALLITARADLRRPAGGGDRAPPAWAGTAAPGAAARLGRAARRDSDRARHLPGHRGRPGRRLVLQHRLLRGADLGAAPGRDLRADRPRPRRDHRPARDRRGRSWRSARSAGSAPRCSSSRSATTTRSSAGWSTSSACRARRW